MLVGTGTDRNLVVEFGKTLHGEEVCTTADTEQRREPLADIEGGGGGEAVAEGTVAVIVGEANGDTAFTLYEPVVGELVEEVALGGIFNVSYFLSVLSNSGTCEHSAAEC